jgi:dihydroxy-acid dehydratase
LIQNGDMITIDSEQKVLSVALSEEELAARKLNWTPPALPSRGTLAKYARLVSCSSRGAVTDLFEGEKVQEPVHS